MTNLLAQATSTNPFGTSGLQPANPRLQVNVGSAPGAQTQTLTNLEYLVSRGVGILTVVAGLFFIIYFLLGAFKWVSAGGDAGKITKARDQIVQAAIGMILIVAAYSIIGLIGGIIGVDFLNPATVIQNIIK